MAQAVEHLSTKHEALSSNPSTTKKKKVFIFLGKELILGWQSLSFQSLIWSLAFNSIVSHKIISLLIIWLYNNLV
jgi:hypothetical protein